MEINGKRLKLPKEVVPNLARAVIVGIATNPGNAQALREPELTAKAYGVQNQ